MSIRRFQPHPPKSTILSPEEAWQFRRAVQELQEAAAREASELAASEVQQSESETEERKGLEWLRRASSRRLQPSGAGDRSEVNAEFEPAYMVPRPQSPDLPFEIVPEDLSGRVVLLPGAESRQRERIAIVAGCVFSAMLATTVAARILSPEGTGIPESESVATELAGHEAKLMAEVRTDASRVPAARAAVEGFLKARTPGEKVAFVRGGAAMLQAMERYYAVHADEPPEFHAVPQAGFGYHGGRAFVMITGSGATGGTVETIVELGPEGPRVDWRFLTGAGDMEWAEWIQARPQVPVTMRAEARLDDYYGGDFADPAEWLCLKLTSPERTQAVWAYVQRKSDSGVRIYRQLHQRHGAVRMAGEFVFPARLHPGSCTAPQVQLVRAAAEGWMDHSPEAGNPSQS